MQGALVIFIAMVVIGILLYVTDVAYFRHHHHGGSKPGESQKMDDTPAESAANLPEPEICCGMHLVCEKTGLAMTPEEIVYYDDEELDRFQGRTAESYTPQECDEFRDVLLTLLPQDVAGWAKSIEMRRITLPAEVKDELMLILSEL